MAALPDAVDGLASTVLDDQGPEAHLASPGEQRRRFTERILAPGEATYVLGEARSRDDVASARNERNLVVGEPGGKGVFVVADRWEEEIRSGTGCGCWGTLGPACSASPWASPRGCRCSGGSDNRVQQSTRDRHLKYPSTVAGSMSEEADSGLSWKTYAGIVACIVVPLALLVPLPSMMADPSTEHGWIALFGTGLGVLGAYIAKDQYGKVQLMRNTPTSKVRSLAVGAAELKGTAHPVDESLTSPLRHNDACMYSLKVEEYRRDQDDSGSNWETVLRLSDEVPFHVDDGTGEVRVEPADASLEIEIEEKVRVDDHDEPPAALGEWAEQQGMVESAEAPDREGVKGWMKDKWDAATASRAEKHLLHESNYDRRYRERVLEVGEETYVFGGAYPRDGSGSAKNPENLVMETHEGTDVFIVSDKGETGAVNSFIIKAAIGLALFLVGIPYGLVSLGYAVGIV